MQFGALDARYQLAQLAHECPLLPAIATEALAQALQLAIQIPQVAQAVADTRIEQLWQIDRQLCFQRAGIVIDIHVDLDVVGLEFGQAADQGGFETASGSHASAEAAAGHRAEAAQAAEGMAVGLDAVEAQAQAGPLVVYGTVADDDFSHLQAWLAFTGFHFELGDRHAAAEWAGRNRLPTQGVLKLVLVNPVFDQLFCLAAAVGAQAEVAGHQHGNGSAGDQG